MAYLLIQGTAQVVEAPAEDAIAALRRRYPQYVAMSLEARPAIRIMPERAVAWGDLGS